MIPTYSFDYETFYSKDYSIRDLGNWAYTHHPQFDAYMMAVAWEGGDWVGRPEEWEWDCFQGALMIAHNAGFEQAVTERLTELGIIPTVTFSELVDTADLTAYLGYPRSLEQASKELLGVTPDKSTRDKAKGRHWPEMTPEFQEEMKRYARGDAVAELQIWLRHNHKWPAWERRLSRGTREMCARGLPTDPAKVAAGVAVLERQLEETRNQIPWAHNEGAAVLSKKELAVECGKLHITPPKSMAKTSEEFDAWLKQHGESVPFAKAMGKYRSINMLLKKLLTIQIRTRPDGVMPYALKYGGAHTLRDSGDAGFNPQNLPRQAMFDVDMRGMFVAPDGYMFGVVDLSAIEPCALATLSRDTEFIGLLKQGMDPYEAQARVTNRYDDPRPLKEVDPKKRQFMKVEVLGLGYGAAADKLVGIAKLLTGLEITLDQACAIVQRFRERPFIPRLWHDLEQAMRSRASKDFTIQLPSDREMIYRKVQTEKGLSALIPRNGTMMRLRFWGGALTENLVQAAARDVFMDRVLAVEDAGHDVRLRVHDEVVCLFPENTAEENLREVVSIMSTAPDKWPELPIAAEGHLCKSYQK